MAKIRDLVGFKSGRLTVVAFAGMRVGAKGKRTTMWLCRCECGNEVSVSNGCLTTMDTKSCGCLAAEKIRNLKLRHGDAAGRRALEYMIWKSMRKRCKNPSDPAFANYGGRGIRVCERWDDYVNFIADMGPKPSPKHTLDRINNDGNYEPENCRWATRVEQISNRRSTRSLTLSERTQTVAQWCRELDLNYGTVMWRLSDGADAAKALRPTPTGYTDLTIRGSR